MEEKNNFVMVRCEFRSDGKVSMNNSFDCDALQLLFFVSKTLENVAEVLNEDPLNIAGMALHLGKFSSRVGDESENGEES